MKCRGKKNVTNTRLKPGKIFPINSAQEHNLKSYKSLNISVKFHRFPFSQKSILNSYLSIYRYIDSNKSKDRYRYFINTAHPNTSLRLLHNSRGMARAQRKRVTSRPRHAHLLTCYLQANRLHQPSSTAGPMPSAFSRSWEQQSVLYL